MPLEIICMVATLALIIGLLLTSRHFRWAYAVGGFAFLFLTLLVVLVAKRPMWF